MRLWKRLFCLIHGHILIVEMDNELNEMSVAVACARCGCGLGAAARDLAERMETARAAEQRQRSDMP